jgi:hypothetical protein
MHSIASKAKYLIFAAANLVSVALFGCAVGYMSAWFGLMASFCLLGVFSLLHPFIPLRVPARWRQSTPGELRFFRSIGVDAFGRWLRRSPARMLNKDVYLTATRKAATVHANLEYAEAAHVWATFLTVPYLVVAFAGHRWAGFAALVIFDGVINIYPVLHLRVARSRVDSILRMTRPRPS